MSVDPNGGRQFNLLGRSSVANESVARWTRRFPEDRRDARGRTADWYDRPLGLVWWKRALDVVLALVALVVTAPLCLVVAVLIKITSPGPILFYQERVGLDRRSNERRGGARSAPAGRFADRRRFVKFGKPFSMYKFRTMHVAAENGRPVWAQEGDPRVTALGRFLRKARIDEIPQFLNVLRGDMSIVGPRPERSYFIASYEHEVPDFKLRLRVKPGITGLAQVSLGYSNSVEGMKRKLGFDLAYIQELSPLTDLKILLRTILVVCTGKGAY